MEFRINNNMENIIIKKLEFLNSSTEDGGITSIRNVRGKKECAVI